MKTDKERTESRQALNDLVTEMQAIYRDNHLEREEGEFTVSEFAEANGLSIKAAENFLNRAVVSGIVSKRTKVFVKGRFTNCFRKNHTAPA